MENKSDSKNQPLTIDDIFNEIKEKSAEGNYIYRGERQSYDDISSALYREYSKHININRIGNFDLTYAQKEMLKLTKNHIGESPVGPLEYFADVTGVNKLPNRSIIPTNMVAKVHIAEAIEEVTEREILTQLQHFGGKTNLIDFTTDYLIALFFACSGDPQDDGRVILLQRTEDIEDMIIHPQNPRHRVIAQKSIFIHPPKGLIEVPEENIVLIPRSLKEDFLKHLGKHHDISTETIYNDIHGFILYQDIHQTAYIQFCMGLTFQIRGYNADNPAERKGEFEKAIRHYNEAINQKSDFEIAFNNRGECWLHLEEWNKAREDLRIAKNMGSDPIIGFRNDYENVAAFEEKTGFEMPKDIAEMLGG